MRIGVDGVLSEEEKKQAERAGRDTSPSIKFEPIPTQQGRDDDTQNASEASARGVPLTQEQEESMQAGRAAGRKARKDDKSARSISTAVNKALSGGRQQPDIITQDTREQARKAGEANQQDVAPAKPKTSAQKDEDPGEVSLFTPDKLKARIEKHKEAKEKARVERVSNKMRDPKFHFDPIPNVTGVLNPAPDGQNPETTQYDAALAIQTSASPVQSQDKTDADAAPDEDSRPVTAAELSERLEKRRRQAESFDTLATMTTDIIGAAKKRQEKAIEREKEERGTTDSWAENFFYGTKETMASMITGIGSTVEQAGTSSDIRDTGDSIVEFGQDLRPDDAPLAGGDNWFETWSSKMARGLPGLMTQVGAFMLNPYLGAGTMMSQAQGSAYNASIDAGVDESEAWRRSLVTGAAQTGLGMIGIGKVMGKYSPSTRGVRGFTQELFKRGGVGAATEMGQQVPAYMNQLADASRTWKEWGEKVGDPKGWREDYLPQALEAASISGPFSLGAAAFAPVSGRDAMHSAVPHSRNVVDPNLRETARTQQTLWEFTIGDRAAKMSHSIGDRLAESKFGKHAYRWLRTGGRPQLRTMPKAEVEVARGRADDPYVQETRELTPEEYVNEQTKNTSIEMTLLADDAFTAGKMVEGLHQNDQALVEDYLGTSDQTFADEAWNQLSDNGKAVAQSIEGMLDRFDTEGLYDLMDHSTPGARVDLGAEQIGKRLTKQRGDTPIVDAKGPTDVTPQMRIAERLRQLGNDAAKKRMLSQMTEQLERFDAKGRETYGAEYEPLVQDPKSPGPPSGRATREMKQLPSDAKYGPLRGKMVDRDIYDAVNETTSIFEQTKNKNGWHRALGHLKLWRTAYSPPTQIRNFVGSSIMNRMAGMPFAKQPQYLSEAALDWGRWARAKKRGQDTSRFKDIEDVVHGGIMTSDFMTAEIGDTVSKSLRNTHPDPNGEYMTELMKFGSNLSRGVGKGWEISKAGGRQAEWLYGSTDKLHKIALKKYAEREMGLTPREATDYARESLLDYSRLPKAIQAFKQSPVGAPFVSFPTKFFPQLAKMLARNPQRLMPVAALSQALDALVFDDVEEREAFEETRPEWQQPFEIGGVKMQLPGISAVQAIPFMNDESGEYNYVDMSWMYPWQSAMNSFQGTGFAPGTQLGVKNIIGLATNRDNFRGSPIVKDEELAGKEGVNWMARYLAGHGKHALRDISPRVLPMIYDEMTGDAGVDWRGDPVSTNERIANWLAMKPSTAKMWEDTKLQIGRKQRDMRELQQVIALHREKYHQAKSRGDDKRAESHQKTIESKLEQLRDVQEQIGGLQKNMLEMEGKTQQEEEQSAREAAQQEAQQNAEKTQRRKNRIREALGGQDEPARSEQEQHMQEDIRLMKQMLDKLSSKVGTKDTTEDFVDKDAQTLDRDKIRKKIESILEE